MSKENPNDLPVNHSKKAGLFKKLVFAAGLTTALGVAIEYTPFVNPSFQYQMERNGLGDWLFDYGIRPIPRVVMVAEANKKLTHHWDWVSTEIDPSFECTKIEGDPGLIHRENFFQGNWFEVSKYNFSKVQISLGAWWRAVQLKPTRDVSSWRLLFKGLENTAGQRTRFIFTGPVKVLQGDIAYMACGEDDNGKEVPLQKSEPFPRWEPVEGAFI